MTLSAQPRRILVAGWITLALCLSIMAVGAFMAGATYPPGNVPLIKAIEAAASTRPAAALASKGGQLCLFVAPAMALTWLIYAAAKDHTPRHRRTLIIVGWTLLLIAGFLAGGLGRAGGLGHVLVSSILVLLSPLNLLLESDDADTYTEGIVTSFGVGAWIWFLIIAGEIDARRPGLPKHLCQHCGYDRTGLDARAACPECGRHATISLTRRRRAKRQARR